MVVGKEEAKGESRLSTHDSEDERKWRAAHCLPRLLLAGFGQAALL